MRLPMKTKAAVLTLAATFVVLFLPVVAPTPAFAFYCGGYLVQVGDDVNTLYANCGPPDLKLTGREEGGETWFYNEGSSQFQTKIVIFGGKVTAIQEGDYGYGTQTAPQPSQ
jgi:hypothetical protein